MSDMPGDRSVPMLLVKLRPTPGDEYRIVTDDVISFQYTDSDRKADLCKLVVDNQYLTEHDDPAWRKGGELIVQWGYHGAMAPARECTITGVKGFKTLQVEARANSIRMNRLPKARAFEGKTISQIVSEIAKENGFASEQLHIDTTTEVLEVVSQARQTDAQFLRRWASRLGFEFYVDWDGLHFHERRMGAQPIRVITYHTDPGQGDVLGEPTIDNDLTARPGRVRVQGRDPVEREDIDESADNETDSERDTISPFIEILDFDTHQTTIVENNVASEEVVVSPDTTPEAALRRAKGMFRRSQQVAVKMKVPIVGDPLLFAKSIVQVAGMSRRLSIRYYVEEVTHDISTSGYKCDVKMVSDGHGGHSTVSNRAVGLEIGTMRGASGNSDDVLALLRNIVDAAEAVTGEGIGGASLAMAKKALRLYQTGRNRSQVAGILIQIARTEELGPEARTMIARAAAQMVQSAEDVSSGGRVNTQDAQTDTEALHPVGVLNPDTNQIETVYRPYSAPVQSGGED